MSDLTLVKERKGKLKIKFKKKKISCLLETGVSEIQVCMREQKRRDTYENKLHNIHITQHYNLCSKKCGY